VYDLQCGGAMCGGACGVGGEDPAHVIACPYLSVG
jgi:hypothetical protein